VPDKTSLSLRNTLKSLCGAGALALVDPIMHGNAEQVFRVEKKLKILST